MNKVYTEKKCSRCTKMKLLTEFSSSSKNIDGHQAWCRVCMNEVSRLHRVEHKEEQLRYWKEYRDKNKKRINKYLNNYRARHKDRVHAALKVQWATESGKMPRAKELICEKCGKKAHDYHHPDYSKPLEVTPLCRTCHRRLHGAGA